MRTYFNKLKIAKMNRNQLWMLLAFAYYTSNEEIIEVVQDEVKQRNILGRM